MDPFNPESVLSRSTYDIWVHRLKMMAECAEQHGAPRGFQGRSKGEFNGWKATQSETWCEALTACIKLCTVHNRRRQHGSPDSKDDVFGRPLHVRQAAECCADPVRQPSALPSEFFMRAFPVDCASYT